MSMIDDGYGAPRPWEQTGDTFEEIEGIVTKFARQCVPPSHPYFDDAVQEGRVTLWRMLGELVDEPERVRYALHHAKIRVRHALFRDDYRPTGHVPMPGRPEVKVTEHLDRPIGPSSTLTVGDMLVGAFTLDGIEMAYHHGEIMQALEALPHHHREYVVRRFWQGWTDAEIARHFGLNQSSVFNRWHRTIRPALVERLEHLAGVA